MKRFLFLIIVLGLLQSCKAQKTLPVSYSDSTNTLLWEISGKGLEKPSYLFGTFHIMCKDDIRFSKNLKSALKNSAEVYFEMDLDDPTNTLGGIFFMNMKDTTLKDLYTEEEYLKVSNFFNDTLHTNIKYLNKMKPMMLEALLYPHFMPCKNASGVEMELMALAQKDKKEIKGFETIAFQASMFDSIPYRTQAKALLKDIDSIGTAKIFLDSMISIYKNQETDKLFALMTNDAFGDVGNTDLLLTKRNTTWVKEIKEILLLKNIFIAVGAGHLFGPDGLIEMLKKEGYAVRAVENK
jgi:uncharacterized protein